MQLDFFKIELQQIAEAINLVVGLDITIMNKNLKRVAGTGKYKLLIGEYAPLNSVFEKCIKTGKQYFIRNPRNCTECLHCYKIEVCTEEAELCYPIISSDGVAGLIGIIAFDDKQKCDFIDNETNYLNFIDHMAKLISSRINENKLQNELNFQQIELLTIIDEIDEGIVAFDLNGKVLCVNKWMRNILRFEESKSRCQNIGDIIRDDNLLNQIKELNNVDEKEVTIYINGISHHFLLSVRYLFVNKKISGAVATFKDINKLQKSIYKITDNINDYSFDKIEGKSKAIIKVKEQAKEVSKQNITVLLLGESGTGKELFARAIHYESERKNEIFMPINCGAIPDSLLESELFGYEKGAFAGANPKGKIGKFEMANGGTVFLDEIGDLPLHMQVKLLRVLQDNQIVRIGGVKPICINVRLIAATNKDLFAMVKSGEFREDLYYRLNVVPICIPPLRERTEDIILLANSMIKRYSKMYNKSILGISEGAKNLMINYYWPGNVRELENLIEYGVIFESRKYLTKETMIKKMHYREEILKKDNLTLKEDIKSHEEKIIKNLLEVYGENLIAKKKIAKILGISTATLYRKIKNSHN